MAPSATWEKPGYRSSPLKVAADLSFPICVEGLPPIPVGPPALVAWPPHHPAVQGRGIWLPHCFSVVSHPQLGLGQGLAKCWISGQPMTSLCLTYKVAEWA